MKEPHTQKDLDQLRKWAANYEDALRILETDLEIKLNTDYDVLLTIDSFDIIEHILPLNTIYASNTREDDLKRAIARDGLFGILGHIYKIPLLLLPPYISETQDFFSQARCELLNLYDKEHKTKIETYLTDLYKELFAERSKKLDSINGLEKHALELALIYNPYFLSGVEGFNRMKDVKFVRSRDEIKDYMGLIKRIHKKNNNYYFNIFYNLRKEYTISNMRDAKAVQYVEEINKAQNNIILILVSSSRVFRYFNNIKKLEKKIGQIDYPLIRDTNSFYIAILEIYLSLNQLNAEDITLNRVLLFRIYRSVQEHLLLLNFVQRIGDVTEDFIDAVEFGSLSGRFLLLKDSFYKLNGIKNVMNEIERNLIIKHISEVYGVNDLTHLEAYVDRKVVTFFEEIMRDMKSTNFYSKLYEKLSILQSQQFEYESWIYDVMQALTPIPEAPEGCGNIKDWIIGTIDGGVIIDIKQNKYEKLNNVLSKGDFPVVTGPGHLELKDGTLIIFNKDSKNNIIYLLKSDEANKLKILKLDMESIYFNVIKIYKAFRSAEFLKSQKLKSCPILQILEDILPHNIEINLNKYDVLQAFYNIMCSEEN